jgi:hypothetical protein
MLDELCEGEDKQIMLPCLRSSRVSLKARRRLYAVRTTSKFLTELIALLSVLYLTTLCLAQTLEHLVEMRINKF